VTFRAHFAKQEWTRHRINSMAPVDRGFFKYGEAPSPPIYGASIWRSRGLSIALNRHPPSIARGERCAASLPIGYGWCALAVERMGIRGAPFSASGRRIDPDRPGPARRGLAGASHRRARPYSGRALPGTLGAPAGDGPMALTLVARNDPSLMAPSTRTLSPTWMSARVMGSRRLRKVVFSSAMKV
jgi:hypothetical protein